MGRAIDAHEFLRGFLDEGEDHLRRITGNLTVVEGAPARPHPQALTELMRSLHTLKGLAGMMEVEPIVELAHAMESLVRTAQRGHAIVPAPALDSLVAGAAALTQCLRAMADGHPVPAAPEALLLALERHAGAMAPGVVAPPRAGALTGLEAALSDKLTPGEHEELRQAFARGDRVLRVAFAPSPARAEGGCTITTVRAALSGVGRVVRVLPRSVAASPASPGGLEFVLLVVTSASATQLAEAAGLAASEVTALTLGESATADVAEAMPEAEDPLARASRRGVVRMHVAQLDVALEQVAALGTGHGRVRDEARSLAAAGLDVRGLQRGLDEQERQIRRMRATLLELRMVPLCEVLEPLPLIVRGLRNATGKEVRLSVDVGAVELDKAVAERLFPALVHVVRNAIDHGIEDPATRRARGKPEVGCLRVEAAAPSSSMLEISISDDGGGIDVERVAKRAGCAVPSSAAQLLDILTTPGFSTRDATTTTSGRGLGLDIVRQTVEALGGTLELSHCPGQGTTLRIRAPLTIAVIAALAFVAGRERYLAPLNVVDAVVVVEPAAVVRPPHHGRHDGHGGAGASLLSLRGEVMPLLSLRELLGQPAAGDETKAMIVRRHGQPFAFAIERMLGCHDVLVRPLVDPLVTVRGVTGSADLGDGRPTLLLDLAALLAKPARAAAEGVRA